jgi:hypothetical protein
MRRRENCRMSLKTRDQATLIKHLSHENRRLALALRAMFSTRTPRGLSPATANIRTRLVKAHVGKKKVAHVPNKRNVEPSF